MERVQVTYTPAQIATARQELIRLRRYLTARPGYAARFAKFLPVLDLVIEMLGQMRDEARKERAA